MAPQVVVQRVVADEGLQAVEAPNAPDGQLTVAGCRGQQASNEQDNMLWLMKDCWQAGRQMCMPWKHGMRAKQVQRECGRTWAGAGRE